MIFLLCAKYKCEGLSEMSDKAAKEIQAVIDSIDTDKSGTINYTGNIFSGEKV